MGAPRIDMVVSVPLMPDPQSVDLGFKANELSVEERNLLSVGYKNMMSVRRTAWRTVESFHQKNIGDHNNSYAELDGKYKDTVSREVFALIREVCEDIVRE